MKISVLMSVYIKEKPEFLKNAIDSILEQTYKADEIILVKDGNLTEELNKVIEEYKSKHKRLFKIIEYEKNKGLGYALNLGVKECKNEIIARMDTDDISKADRFFKQIKILKENPNIDVVGSWVDEFIEDINNLVSIRRVPQSHEEIKKFMKLRNPINHPVVMFKKTAILDVGNYQRFHLNEDYYLWGRLMAKGYKFYNIQESLLYFRSGEDVFARRGGLSYAKADLELQKEFLKLRIITKNDFIKNIFFRVPIRLLPNKLRKYIYQIILRK